MKSGLENKVNDERRLLISEKKYNNYQKYNGYFNSIIFGGAALAFSAMANCISDAYVAGIIGYIECAVLAGFSAKWAVEGYRAGKIARSIEAKLDEVD